MRSDSCVSPPCDHSLHVREERTANKPLSYSCSESVGEREYGVSVACIIHQEKPSLRDSRVVKLTRKSVGSDSVGDVNRLFFFYL